MAAHLYRLGDGCTIKHGFAFKGEHMSEAAYSDLPIVVNIGNFQYTGGFRFETTKIQRYSGEFPQQFIMSPGDVLLVMTCQTPGGEILGIPGRIPSDGRTYLHNQRMGKVVVTRPDELSLDYLYYLFLSPAMNAHLVASASGAKILHTAPDRIESFKWRRPPIHEQRRIASILSAYDDLIENNTKRIKILEEMARSLYREWFVNFRVPGHEKAKFVRSPLGKAPDGWLVVPFDAAVDISPRTEVPKEGEKPFLPMTSLSNDSMLIGHVESREGNSGAKFKNGDTLFARITPCLENGKTGFVQFLPDDDAVGFGSTEFIVLREKLLTREMVYLLTREPSFREHAIKSMSGASGRQRVQEKCFSTYLVATPPAQLAQRFSSLASPLFQQVLVLAKKNEVLRATRDLLLPRLISGEIDVSSLPLELAAS